MTLINVTALTDELEVARAALAAALAQRRDMRQRGIESAAAEPTAVRDLEVARAALDEAEMEFAFTTDDDEKTLRAARDRKRREFHEAEEVLNRIQQLRRGIAKYTESADAAILAARVPFIAACEPFCAAVLAEYRALLRNTLFGGMAAEPLARLLRLGYALHNALPFCGTLRSMLEGIKIPDLAAPGRPFLNFIQGDRAWPGEDDLAGASLRNWHDDTEIVAAYALLKPLGAVYAEAMTCIPQIEAARAAAPAPLPAAPAPPPEPQKLSAEEFLASQPSDAEHRAIMQGYREEAAKGVTAPMPLTYSEGRFGELA